MTEVNLNGVKLIIYHINGKYPLLTCKPNYLGFMGIFLKGIHLDYPAGTPLEVEFQIEKNSPQNQRVSMIMNKSEDKGTGLRLTSFDKDVITNWKNTLVNLLGQVQKA